MIDCYEAITSPSFFDIEGECGIVNHDIKVSKGGLATSDNSILSAILIQLNSDQKSEGERGFWGDQFLGFPLGTKLWTLQGRGSFVGITVKADELIREGLTPLIDQGLIDELRVRPVRTIDGVDASVDALKNNVSIFSTVI